MNESPKLSLLGMDREELAAWMTGAGEPSYRAKQIMDAVYRQRLQSLEEISTLPAGLREKFAADGVQVGTPRIEKKFESVDGTVRYLIGFADGQSVETVWMPEGDGGEAGDGSDAGVEAEFDTNTSEAKIQLPASEPSAPLTRYAAEKPNRSTICISSQVGCAVDCQFCLTALLGVKRNLTAGEIVGQVCAVLNDQQVSPPEDRINLVFMGMGEPFLNYDSFMKASRLLVEAVGIAERRMTVSTAGIVPRIHDFGKEKIRPKLAISLNAPNDVLRTQLMPLNKKWNLDTLLAAARDFPLRAREWITFEYVLLGGVNDEPQTCQGSSCIVARAALQSKFDRVESRARN